MIALYCFTHIILPTAIIIALADIIGNAIIKRFKARQRKVKVAQAKADMEAQRELYQHLILNEIWKGAGNGN